MTTTDDKQINRQYCTDRIRVDYAHVGLFDAKSRNVWIAKKRWGVVPVRVSHARMLKGGTQDTSTAEKDRFICYWFHTPNTGEGHVHGYPIEWEEGHLLIRLDPNWNFVTRAFIPNTDTAKIERNIRTQLNWGQRIFEAYAARKPKFPLSWHAVGPRAADSIFYVERIEPGGGG
ncbi:hypothetical protein [Mucisphaera calidilacus]|uniref:Uncharacterized protein n=1 Tax=Mucisphaera calidilacus TaxID=2527982 RepID=A0A518C067_9BACT|nr:hypothetical protein [Mucisphaera calidilacus]QDU72609.1 hypothetical protein Pan265_24800 [Mucisphaera calidilacus]